MAMVRKTITVTEKMDAWIKSRVESGDYGNDSEYIRDLMRRDESHEQATLELRRQIQAGIDSGISDQTAEEIWEEAKAEYLSAKHEV